MSGSFSVDDLVEITSINEFKPMPGGLGLGSRGTVVGTDSTTAGLDNALPPH